MRIITISIFLAIGFFGLALPSFEEGESFIVDESALLWIEKHLEETALPEFKAKGRCPFMEAYQSSDMKLFLTAPFNDSEGVFLLAQSDGVGVSGEEQELGGEGEFEIRTVKDRRPGGEWEVVEVNKEPSEFSVQETESETAEADADDPPADTAENNSLENTALKTDESQALAQDGVTAESPADTLQSERGYDSESMATAQSERDQKAVAQGNASQEEQPKWVEQLREKTTPSSLKRPSKEPSSSSTADLIE